MKASDIVLNIAVNLERLSKWSQEGNTKRIDQFLLQTERYFDDLKKVGVDRRFNKTLTRFEKEMEIIKNTSKDSPEWAEKTLTWANILTHRSKLA